MTKIYLFLLLLWAIILNAQPLTWTKISPTPPPGFPYRSAIFLGQKKLIWATFCDGSIPFKEPTAMSYSISADGGNTWSTQGYFPFAMASTKPYGFTFMGFTPLSTSMGLYLCAIEDSYAKVFKTSDGGMTWKTTAQFDTYPYSIHFFDDKNGIVVCREDASQKLKIYRTTDAGDSWQKVDPAYIPSTIGYETGVGLFGFVSSYKDTFWFGTNSGRIFKTNNKGLTWTVASSPYIYGGVTGVFADSMGPFTLEDENNAYMVEYNSGKLHRTTDGGLTWTTQGKIETGSANFHIIKVPNSDILLAAGEKTRYSLDKGLTWTEIDNDPKFGIYSNSSGFTTSLSYYKLTGIIDKTPIETGTPGDNKDEDEFGIYPIPTGNYLYIRSKTPIDSYIIWDSAGRLIQTGGAGNQINVSWFAEGTYHIEIHHAGNTIIKKFIKK
ncbi:MAG TPA: hypothetical protein DIT10_11600 [Chryseobacterium sp.]|nr:hypothetical protein [Chryseobacterium sp.]